MKRSRLRERSAANQFAFRVLLLLLTFSFAGAQPSEIWVTHDANTAIRSIAPGSIFSVGIAGQLGPLPSQSEEAFPLRTSLAGISVRVEVGGINTDAFVLSTEAYKVRAMLPSSTRVGQGELRLIINGRPYSSAIRVVRRQFALYTKPTAEPWWPRWNLALAHTVDTGGNWSANALRDAAQPGELLVLWGTGFGATAGDERAIPLPGDRSSEVEVVVGKDKADVLYAGRSGCCPGIDQIVARIPRTVEGCFVPVWVTFPGTNEVDQVQIAVNSSGGRCADLPAEVVDRMDVSRSLNLGFISLGKVAVFGPAPFIVSPLGTCRLGAVPAGDIEFSYGEYNHGSAGPALNIQTPQGSELWPWSPYLGGYMGPRFAQSSSSIVPGEYVVENGAGGFDVGPFQAKFVIPPISFTWTNQNDTNAINRRTGVTLTWSGGSPEHGHVIIRGGAAFTCIENVEKRSFTVPPYVLSAMQAGVHIELTVGFESAPMRLRFQAPQLDFAYGSYHVGSSKTVVIQ